MGAEPVLRDAGVPAGLPRLVDLDAVTLDANGTLVRLVDPVPLLLEALAIRDSRRPEERVRTAVAAEYAYYRAHVLEGRNAASLADLRRACTAVFLEHAGARLDAAEFTPAYVESLRFETVPGAREAVARLRAHGVALAVVSNWDCGIHEHLERAGLSSYLSAVVSAAEAGVAKPAARIFAIALEALAVRPQRVLHVGDGDDDREGALAAGVHFAPAPLERALRELV